MWSNFKILQIVSAIAFITGTISGIWECYYMTVILCCLNIRLHFHNVCDSYKLNELMCNLHSYVVTVEIHRDVEQLNEQIGRDMKKATKLAFWIMVRSIMIMVTEYAKLWALFKLNVNEDLLILLDLHHLINLINTTYAINTYRSFL